MRAPEQRHVLAKLPFGNQRAPEPLDRHVRQRVEMIENNAMAHAELALVIGLERLLARWQRWALRVVYKVEHKTAAFLRVAKRIEARQAGDALFVDSFAPLAVDQVFGVAGQRRGD